MLSILQDYSILYVEDEPTIQADIQEYLEYYFKKVYLASEGEEALSIYREVHPDVLLLDINIPNIDGLSLAKEVRQTDKLTKIIMLTGITKTHKLLEATELKLTKYLVKPVSPKAFKESMILLARELIEDPIEFVHLGEHCIWDSNKKILIFKEKHILLLEKELKLLELFIEKRGQSVSYEDIMVVLWEDSFEKEISINSVKNQVSHLRKKLPKSAITNIYGCGYRLI